MSMQSTEQQAVQDAIRAISHIATLPEITMKIIAIVEDPASTANDLIGVISNDPALCSRILKVVNSSFYGLPGQIGSIDRAVVMLGLNAVKNIAISASMAKLFRGGQLAKAFGARDLWMHSVATAAAAKMLADAQNVGMSDEAFLSGLVHDIGIMVELQFDRAKLLNVVMGVAANGERTPTADWREFERDEFGATHEEFGAALCEKWKFPDNLCRVAGHHHNPMELAAGERSMACLVNIADRLASELRDAPFRLDLPSVEIDGSVMDEAGVAPEVLAGVRAELSEKFNEVALLLS
jgi:putative nucleotidyltransferase with HDIG domain